MNIGESNLLADLFAVEQLDVVAEPAQRRGLLVEPRQLVRLHRDVEIAAGGQVAVDPEPLEIIAACRRSSRARAARASAISSGNRAGPLPIPWVRNEERNRRCARSRSRRSGPPSSTTTSASRSRLAQHGGPEPAQPAADDRELGARVAVERRAGRGATGRVEPERRRQGVGEGAAVGLGRSPRRPRTVPSPAHRLGSLLRRCISSSQLVRVPGSRSPRARSPVPRAVAVASPPCCW